MNKNTVITIAGIGAAVIVAAFFVAYTLGMFTPKSTTTEEPAKARIIKVVKTYKDVATAEKLSADGSDRKLTITEIPAGTEIMSVTTNVVDAFTLSEGITASAVSLRAEVDGVEVSSGDLAAMPALNVKGISNLHGSANEFGLYSFDQQTSILFRMLGDNNTDLAQLRSGIIEFYITVVSL